MSNRRVERRADRAGANTHHLGDLLVIEIRVVAKKYRRPLPQRKRGHQLTQLGVRLHRHRCSGLSRCSATRHTSSVPAMVARDVHDRPPQPGLQRSVTPELQPPTDRPGERLLHRVTPALHVAQNRRRHPQERGKPRPIDPGDLLQPPCALVKPHHLTAAGGRGAEPRRSRERSPGGFSRPAGDCVSAAAFPRVTHPRDLRARSLSARRHVLPRETHRRGHFFSPIDRALRCGAPRPRVQVVIPRAVTQVDLPGYLVTPARADCDHQVRASEPRRGGDANCVGIGCGYRSESTVSASTGPTPRSVDPASR